MSSWRRSQALRTALLIHWEGRKIRARTGLQIAVLYTSLNTNPTTKPTDLNFGFVRNTFSFKWLQDIEGLFQMLDYDGGGSLDTDEFCEGLDLRNWWMVIGCDVQISLVEASWELQLVRSHWSSLVWWNNALIFWNYVTWIQKGSLFKSRLMIWWRKKI